MNFKTLFQKNSIAARLLIALVIYLITFPAFNLITSPGLDSSYTWGLNYLLVHDYETLKQLVYPIGVLGFLKMPLAIGNNLIWAIVFYSIIKFWFLFSLLSLSISEYKVKRIIQFVLVVIISMYSGFDITLVALCVLLGIRFLEHQKLLSILMLTIVAYISFNIKTSIGISAFSVLFMTVTINFLKLKDWKQLLKIIGISISTILIIGIILFQDFGLIVTRFFQAFKISSGYSSSLSLHPDNNWLVLSGFILSILLIPLIFKTKRIRILFYQFLPSFFMMWKHAMVREDASHNGILFYFTLIFWAMAIIYCNKNIWRMGILGIASMSLFYLNLKNIDGFNRINLNLNGIKNLNEIVHYKKCVEDNNQITSKELEKLKLNSETLNTIGQQTIDFYPWEHAYAKVNNLNWSPRKTLEIGASSSRWSSEIAASHYQGDSAPEFVLFHYYADKYEGKLSSIDGRYLLNDEPLVVFNLLKNYKIRIANDTFVVFKKLNEPNIIIEKEEEISVYEFF